MLRSTPFWIVGQISERSGGSDGLCQLAFQVRRCGDGTLPPPVGPRGRAITSVTLTTVRVMIS